MIKFDSSLSEARGPETGRERIIEIIFFLLKEIRENTPLTEIDLQPLSVRGFSEIEISTAFSWLIDKFSTNPGDDPVVLAVPFGKRASMLDPSKNVENAGFRVYHDIERSVITPEARGFMLQMVELGLLSDSDQEFLIDRIMLSGISSATLEDVKELVSNTIFHFDSSFSTQGRLMLNGSERVH
jgi:uncharacterized protein Smg (DUF494 family)